ncbi:MAG: D-glycerate dehydrogenase [Anaerolineae bacterium]|nr:D-glycerate dehydrogenase [Anaerolineae bacterium]
MSKPKVFVTRAISEKGFELINDFCDVDLWMDDLPPSREDLLQRVRGVDGLLCLLTDRIDGQVMDASGQQLKVISNFAVGFDNIDINSATARKIPVGNTPDVLTDATADFAFALILSVGRRLMEGERYVRNGQWKTWGPMLLLGIEMKGATLGLVGFGRIGKAVARRAMGFDMRVIYYSPHEKKPDPDINATRVDFETLLEEADIISLHTPLTTETRHLIDSEAISKMKPTVVLINSSRGSVVDLDALYEALKFNRIFGAGLDVTEPEPLPLDSPLLTLDNIVIMPHIASASKTARDKMSWMAAKNLIAGLEGITCQIVSIHRCINDLLTQGLRPCMSKLFFYNFLSLT